MDIQTIDQQYNQLQQEAQQVAQGIQTLAQKLKAASDSGDQNAREYLLDLRELAINIQQEQQQVMAVMQSVHQAMQNQGQRNQGQQTEWQPGYPQTPHASYGQPQQQGGGFLSEFLNSGFGRAIEMGAGFGIGDDLINSIF
jgi:predicted  nucleic acid-binding Zn-ribbon protein